MNGRWMLVGMLVVGSSSLASAQNAPRRGSISVTTVYPDQSVGALAAGQWTAVPTAASRPTRVSTLSLAPVPVAGSRYVVHAAGVPVPYDMAPYASPAVTPVVPAPVPPVGPVISEAPHGVLRPLIPLVSPQPTYYFGQGLIGQPKLYVPGQPLRNVLRYLSP